MASVVGASHDVFMIWWVLGAAVVVVIGLVYVMRHESDFCSPVADERRSDRLRGDPAAEVSRRAA